MSLPLPNLDDRRWADLVEEGRSLIPLYASEWTDHNVHDPGITLIELFAWVAEMDVYQLNRVPERHKRKFLALIGVRPEPPRPAITVLGFKSKDETLTLPAAAEFEGKDPLGQPARFRTLDEINVIPGEIAAIQFKDEKGFHDLTDRWRRGEKVSLFGGDPRPGAELYLGFTQPFPPNKTASLFFIFLGLKEGEEERIRLIREIEARRKACRPPDSVINCEKKDTPSPNERNENCMEKESEKTFIHHSVRTVWEFLTEQGKWQVLDPAEGQVEDWTRNFTLNGRLLLSVPGGMKARSEGSVGEELYYIRCRFTSGAYDQAPTLQNLALNGVLAEQAVPVGNFNLTAPGSPGVGTLLIGQGSGRPNQQITLPEKPVQESSFHLFTIEEEKWLEWILRPDFDASGRDNFHFLLDPTRGVVTFGDGERGRVIPHKASVVVSYRATRAEEGNLASSTINKLAESVHNRRLLADFAQFKKDQLAEINNPLPAVGGSPAETVDHAAGRAIELMEKPRRAVTLADCETLATQTPGVRLARVSARANIHPGFPCFKAPGIITVIILPYLPADKPTPGRELRQAVAAYLARRRVIGTCVEVVGPDYLKVAVQVQVQSCKGTNKAGLRERIKERLNGFFHPIKGGPDGKGWPFGRDVYRSEVLQVVDETPGVDHVLSMDLIPDGGAPQCGNVCLGPTGLVEAGQHQIEVL